MPYTITSRIETYTDHSPDFLREWHYKDAASSPGYVELDEAFMDGIIIFRKELVIELPQYTSNINLTTFINANNPDNYIRIRVINNLTQPSIYTGLLTGLEVTLENNGDILGTVSGATALVIQAPLTLENNSHIKGAGGVGGTGSGGGPTSRSVGTWQARAAYDDGVYVEGQMSLLANSSQSGPYYNRFWKTSGGVNSGAWVQRAGTNQHYFNTSNAGTWGNQANTYADSKTPRCRHGSGTGLQIVAVATEGYTASVGGVGGAGAHFGLLTPANGSAGSTGSHYGPTSGFNPSTGFNLSALTPPPTGSPGASGGVFGSVGNTVPGGGAAGQPGNAITGNSNILPNSSIGNTVGAVI